MRFLLIAFLIASQTQLSPLHSARAADDEPAAPGAEGEARAAHAAEGEDPGAAPPTVGLSDEEAAAASQRAADETRLPVPSAESPRRSSNAFSRFFRRLFGYEKDEEKAGAEPPETEDSQAGTPDTLTPEGDSGGTPEEILSDEYKSASRSWSPPDYSGQEKALSWGPEAFGVPENLRARVDFWKAIYSKYSTQQGVLHDSVHLNVVYEPIDFGPIMRDASLTPRQKAKARERLVDSRRKEHEERLRRLAKVRSADGLTGEDLRVWELFEKIEEPGKFEAAAQKTRVRFQLGQRDRFILGIYYSGRYIREMERIFRDSGLPIELTRLPFVESSFNIFARSKVGASGVWQFMRRTARPYMMVSNNVDERNDPLASTRASARLLKANFQMLGSWPLAVTGYNHGPSGVARIVRKTGTKDLAEIINTYSSRTFGFASENFYACFLAALEVEKNARQYLGDVKWSTAFDGVEIKVSRSLPHKTLLVWFGGDEGLARLHNFHLRAPVLRGRSPIPRGTFIRVPAAKRDAAFAFMKGSIEPSRAAAKTGAEGAAPVADRSAESAAAARSMSGPNLGADAGGARRHRVKRGENLSRIARDYGTTTSALKEANGLDDGARIRRGQWLMIPD